MPDPNIALFIDYENVHYGLVNILIKKAYADWEKQEFKGVQAALKKSGIEPAYTLSKKTSKGGQMETWKDSADAVLLLDALQTLFERTDIDEFAIVTGDRAALDLVHRLRSRGKRVRLCALESALAQELTDAVEEEVISIEKLLGIEPLVTNVAFSTITPVAGSEPDWAKVIVELAAAETKYSFVGCSLLKNKHGFTQQVFTRGTTLGLFEIYQVPNPNNQDHPTSAVRLKRDNDLVIKVLGTGVAIIQEPEVCPNERA